MRKLKQSKRATETSTETSGTTSPFPGGEFSFTANRKDLARSLKRVSGIADRKSALPILGYVGIVCDGQTVSLMTTDLNVCAVHTATAWIVSSPGAACVPVKALSDVLAKVPDGDVTITASSEGGVSVTLTTGSASIRLEGLASTDFPKFPSMTEDGDEADAGELAAMLGSVEHAICQDETRFHLNGIFLRCDASRTVAVATDGHRLAKRESVSLGAGGHWLAKGVILPRKGALAIRKMLTRGTCELGVTGISVFCRQGGTTLAVKPIDAQFPPFEQVIPTRHDRLITLDRAALISTLERVKLVCTECRGARLRADFDTLQVSGDLDGATVSESLPAETRPDAETFTVGINPRYLLEALANVRGDRVTLACSDELAPVLVRSEEYAAAYAVTECPMLVVIMPMRV